MNFKKFINQFRITVNLIKISKASLIMQLMIFNLIIMIIIIIARLNIANIAYHINLPAIFAINK